jgi:hypothetical protein
MSEAAASQAEFEEKERAARIWFAQLSPMLRLANAHQPSQTLDVVAMTA